MSAFAAINVFADGLAPLDIKLSPDTPMAKFSSRIRTGLAHNVLTHCTLMTPYDNPDTGKKKQLS